MKNEGLRKACLGDSGDLSDLTDPCKPNWVLQHQLNIDQDYLEPDNLALNTLLTFHEEDRVGLNLELVQNSMLQRPGDPALACKEKSVFT
ncbi:hypothetical protein CFP56_013516 [Quercus suber]|uniref:Uncharacterized protein n=1 Tax=Quercus suber TaxID=58331 RepID=A0AAW0KT51_QUESU